MANRRAASVASHLALTILAAALFGCSEDETIYIDRIDGAAVAVRLAEPESSLLRAGAVVLRYRLVAESAGTADLVVEVTADGGLTYARAAESVGFPGHQGTTGLAYGPGGGVEHVFVWDSSRDVPLGTAVRLHVTPVVDGIVGVPAVASFRTELPEDRFEPNEDLDEALDITELVDSGAPIEGLAIGPGLLDEDYFSYANGADPVVIHAAIRFENDFGDLDLVAFNENGEVVTAGLSVDDDEEVTLLAAAGETIYLGVVGFELARNGYTLEVATRTLTGVTTLLEEDFEAPGTPGDLATLASGAWSRVALTGTTNDWELGEPLAGPGYAYSGDGALGTLLDEDRYSTSADAAVVAPSLTIPAGKTGFIVEMAAYIDIEDEFDVFRVEVSVDGGAFREVFERSGDQTLGGDYGLFVIEGPSVAPGSAVRVRFRLTSDSSIVESGVYLDDIRISAID